ncbi:fluoride efflux transporter CrcB [Marinimicrobium alkaliphilum]|uniref:fluoride efflux transporter CrcB n=1 Tax=Marinimicrobium alkaliphilum TaxID=2202654 RepID=UPI0018E0A0D4|nr:fluoride efflux transporter CrcB [Marinimicrobium alkaliphilum]
MSQYWLNIFAVAAGSALGGVLRYWVSTAVQHQAEKWRAWRGFPWGTLVVNVTGAILAGLLIGLSVRLAAWSAELQLLLLIGFCGSYTTVSSFALQTLALGRSGNWLGVAANLLGSLLLCLLGVYLGRTLAGVWL